MNLILTNHFSLSEFIRSATAERRGISNRPSLEDVMRMQQLCIHVLEPLRNHFGIIRINSGYRCQLLNAAVGGASNSQHILGEAADIAMKGRDEALEIYNFIRDHLDFDQLIWEPRQAKLPRWLHVSYSNRHKNRRQCL